MSRYFQTDAAANPLLGPGPGACETYSMATLRGSSGRLTAYAQEFCDECRNGEGLTPAVFTLDGDNVVSVKAATAEGDPDFYKQIQKIFPSSLWSEANAQTVPDVHTLQRKAEAEAHCG